ncbi:uncharacterized protein LOC109611478 [Ooceraea biroi]|uniref:uncharacterized protein LOC109611478 n=1 Tax=Ooceraea biroi TaxID=2015173 RepID=UPI000F07CA4E|nr:uncharacterized protein LOC109611478 [Ooceraea biroi]
MELHCTKERKIHKKQEEATKQDKNDKKINIHQLELCTQSIKRSNEFGEQPVKKARKKHCSWIKFSSDDYCLNTKFAKHNRAYEEVFNRLKNCISDESGISDLSQECKTSSRSTKAKREDQEKVISEKDDYYTLLRQRRAEFRMHLIRKIKGSGKSDESQQEDMMEICSSYAKERTLLNNDDGVRERASSVSASSRSIDDDTDGWITEEDKNLLRYYYYILHEVDDARAGTLDSDTLKKITSMVSAEWQERHNEYLGRLIHEIKRDYVTSMKKSIVDFVLQEPFEEVYEFFAPVSIT